MDDTLYNKDIALSHIDEIKKLAEEMGITIKVDEKNEELVQNCKIEINMDSKEKVNDIADYILKLDEILKYNIKEGSNKTFFKVEVIEGQTVKDIYIPENEDERNRYTKSYYVAELEK